MSYPAIVGGVGGRRARPEGSIGVALLPVQSCPAGPSRSVVDPDGWCSCDCDAGSDTVPGSSPQIGHWCEPPLLEPDSVADASQWWPRGQVSWAGMDDLLRLVPCPTATGLLWPAGAS